MLRRLLATVAAVACLAPTALAQEIPTQGAVIHTPTGVCTLGYSTSGYGYIAAHCGSVGDPVSINGQQVGVIDSEGTRDVASGANDWAVVRWSVPHGGNPYTGDDIGQPRPGDKICRYGATTGSVTCGTFAGRVGTSLFFDGPPASNGDSGGPVWLNRNGSTAFVGVLSGTNEVTVNGRSYSLNRASFPADGPAYSLDDVIPVFDSFFGISSPSVRASTLDPAKALALVPDLAIAGSELSSTIIAKHSSKETAAESSAPAGNTGLSVIQLISVVASVVGMIALLSITGALPPEALANMYSLTAQ